MTDTLKPCPFCGGKATAAKSIKGWKVECEGRMGSCLINARTHYQPQKHLAYTAWNTRSEATK
jgi:Lar family restriction alleviation protein